jgi:hypothetical protein
MISSRRLGFAVHFFLEGFQHPALRRSGRRRSIDHPGRGRAEHVKKDVVAEPGSSPWAIDICPDVFHRLNSALTGTQRSATDWVRWLRVPHAPLHHNLRDAVKSGAIVPASGREFEEVAHVLAQSASF